MLEVTDLKVKCPSSDNLRRLGARSIRVLRPAANPEDYAPVRIMSAAFSAIMITGLAVLPELMRGISVLHATIFITRCWDADAVNAWPPDLHYGASGPLDLLGKRFRQPSERCT